jgi:hypothetical protein
MGWDGKRGLGCTPGGDGGHSELEGGEVTEVVH